MTAVILLFVVGVVLLASDVFVTSFFLGTLGGLAMLGGCVQAYREFGALGAGAAAVVAVVLLGVTIYLELVVLPKSRFGRGLIVQSTAGTTSQPELATAAQVVGRPAQSLTVLAPSGYVLVEGRRYEAFCQSGHVPKGAALRVVGVDNFRLIVSKT